MNMRMALLVLAWVVTLGAQAAPGVRVWESGQAMENTYDTVYKSLEENGFYVVFEPNIQKNLSHFAERWGDNYNRNGLEGIRAMVFCNGWYANAVSNADPELLALCPLHVTLIQKDGKTRVLFTRPTLVAAGSQAEAVAKEIEDEVAKALDAAMKTLAKP